MSNKLEFKQLNAKVRFKKKEFNFTENQIDFLKTVLKDESKLIFLSGPAGTAKTYMAVYSALQMLINSDLEKEILYIRSIAESAQKNMGALPGSLDEKFSVFATPFYDKVDEMLDIQDIKILRLDMGADIISEIIKSDDKEYTIKNRTLNKKYKFNY